MTEYTIAFKRSAAKELRALKRDAQERIFNALKLLKVDPFSDILPIRKMRGHKHEHRFRMRVGDYRIVYEVEKQEVVVSVVRIRHRKDVYR